MTLYYAGVGRRTTSFESLKTATIFAKEMYKLGYTLRSGGASGADSAFYPVEPAWVLVGSKQNSLQVQLPQAMAAVETNSRAVLILRGHLAQNVTPVR